MALVAAFIVVAEGITLKVAYFRSNPQFPILNVTHPTVEKLPDNPSIVVLPFVNISDDPKQEYFGDGITEQTITALSNYPGLFVIERNSSFTYKGKAVKAQQVSEDLGVRYVLEGSVQKAGDRVRITAQLIDATTGNHLWAERYDRELKDIFTLQDEIAVKILGAMGLKITSGESLRFISRGTKNLNVCSLKTPNIFTCHSEITNQKEGLS